MPNNQIKIDRFDIRAWLQDKGIPYTTEGRNTTVGWINMKCPFCDDNSNHLGISPTNVFSCWKCGAKGDIIKLVCEVGGVNFREAQKIIGEYQDYTIKQLRQDIRLRYTETPLPPEAHDTIPPLYLAYLQKRRYDSTYLISKYKIKAFPNFGLYKFRIAIPCLFKQVVVNFTALDVTGKAKSKYKHCPNEEATIPMKELLYNLDNAGKRLIVVEGVTDVWRLGDGAVATMGIMFTTPQIKLLTEHKAEAITIMFDAEPLAQKQANKLANALSLFVPKVDVYVLPNGDPDDLTDEQAAQIRKELL